MIPKKERVTRLDYCQYLLVSPINYTLTNHAEHTEKFSHDMANRYLAGDDVRPRLVWENIKNEVRLTAHGFLVFDDSVMDKNFSRHIELVRRQSPRLAPRPLRARLRTIPRDHLAASRRLTTYISDFVADQL